MQWINTKDQSPDIGEEVLGYWPGGDQHVVYFTGSEWFNAWHEEDASAWEEPSHWMTLPVDPEYTGNTGDGE